jgi:hypothetical protein
MSDVHRPWSVVCSMVSSNMISLLKVTVSSIIAQKQLQNKQQTAKEKSDRGEMLLDPTVPHPTAVIH